MCARVWYNMSQPCSKRNGLNFETNNLFNNSRTTPLTPSTPATQPTAFPPHPHGHDPPLQLSPLFFKPKLSTISTPLPPCAPLTPPQRARAGRDGGESTRHVVVAHKPLRCWLPCRGARRDVWPVASIQPAAHLLTVIGAAELLEELALECHSYVWW